VKKGRESAVEVATKKKAGEIVGPNSKWSNVAEKLLACNTGKRSKGWMATLTPHILH